MYALQMQCTARRLSFRVHGTRALSQTGHKTTDADLYKRKAEWGAAVVSTCLQYERLMKSRRIWQTLLSFSNRYRIRDLDIVSANKASLPIESGAMTDPKDWKNMYYEVSDALCDHAGAPESVCLATSMIGPASDIAYARKTCTEALLGISIAG